MADTSYSIVRPDADRVIELAPGVAAHLWPNGEIGIAHDCKMIGNGRRLRHAPVLTTPNQPGGHQVLSLDPLTISPSFLCSDCGLHGFITDGAWKDC